MVQFTCRKMETFLFAQIISEKIASSETLTQGNLYLFPCSGNPSTILKPFFIDNFCYWLQSRHRQFFLPASVHR